MDYPQGEEKVNRCKAIRDMREEALAKGRVEVHVEGCVKSRAEEKKATMTQNIRAFMETTN